MIIELERRPRIAVDVFVKVESGELIDLADLHALFVTLDLGDVPANDIITDPETPHILADMGVVEFDGTMLSAGPKYAEFRREVCEVCEFEGIEFDDDFGV